MNIFDLIEKYSKIAIFRHVRPDFDAYGSQYGLAQVIRDHYPDKKIMILGEIDHSMVDQLTDEVYDSFDDTRDALAIVLDTANRDRIDGNIEGYHEVLKIDHHIVVDSYGTYNIEIDNSSSCCQILALLCQKYLDYIPVNAARSFYFGMITDSNRFMYRNTGIDTFQAASYLLLQGIDIEEIYQTLYTKDIKELEIQKYILNHYCSKGNILYYILKQEDLDYLQISRSKGSDYVGLIANIENYPVWVAVTQNIEESNYRVSIRSSKVTINKVAAKYHGGGHALASGCSLDNLEQLSELLNDLQIAIDEANKE